MQKLDNILCKSECDYSTIYNNNLCIYFFTYIRTIHYTSTMFTTFSITRINYNSIIFKLSINQSTIMIEIKTPIKLYPHNNHVVPFSYFTPL